MLIIYNLYRNVPIDQPPPHFPRDVNISPSSMFPYIPLQLSSHSDCTNVDSNWHLCLVDIYQKELEENTRVGRVGLVTVASAWQQYL
jgi:hypothetical protein